jgi:hypothetical protein
MTVTGTSCIAPVTLQSTSAGVQYTLNIGTTAFANATLKDAIASPTQSVATTGDLGNNSGWTFTGGCTPAPDTLYVHDTDASAGSANPTGITSDTPHFSVLNSTGQLVDQQQARVVTTPLTNVVALWQFDTGTGQAADTSGNGRTLTLTGAPSSPAGQSGFSEALGLDGSTQHASITDAALQLSTSFTVEAWVKAPDTTGSKVITERTSGTSRNWRLDFSAGTLRAHATRNSSGITSTVSTSAAAFADGGWHHVAMVVDAGNVLRLYLDGAPSGTAAIGGVVWSGAAAATIGRNAVGAEYFGGQVDDLRVSSAPRTAAEILGYTRLRDAHAKTIWASGNLGIACASGARCADAVYAGPLLHRPAARYYVQMRSRLQAWAVYTAWSNADWFETGALLTIAVPGGDIDLGSITTNSDVVSTTTVEVESAASFGYQLLVSDASDTVGLSGPSTLPDWTGAWNTPTTWPAATPGYFGLTVVSATGGKDTATWGTGTTSTDFANLKYVGVRSSNPSVLRARTGPSGGTDQIVVGLRANAPLSQMPGAYTSTLTFTAIAVP